MQAASVRPIGLTQRCLIMYVHFSCNCPCISCNCPYSFACAESFSIFRLGYIVYSEGTVCTSMSMHTCVSLYSLDSHSSLSMWQNRSPPLLRCLRTSGAQYNIVVFYLFSKNVPFPIVCFHPIQCYLLCWKDRICLFCSLKDVFCVSKHSRLHIKYCITALALWLFFFRS